MDSLMKLGQECSSQMLEETAGKGASASPGALLALACLWLVPLALSGFKSWHAPLAPLCGLLIAPQVQL